MDQSIKDSNIADDYSISWGETLGSGVNGDVYKCKAIKTGQEYAVKILPDCEDTRKEIHILNLCKGSDKIVRIQDVFSNELVSEDEHGKEREEECLFLVMEFMNGGELFDYMEKNPLCEIEAKMLMRQIVEAVNFLHTKNIVHRDLKPENILLSTSTSESEKKKNITLKLADFGYADLDNNGLTNALYTLYYVSPEVLVNDSRFNKEAIADGPIPYDKRCDLWSLGVVAYIMLMRYPPFYPDESNVEMTSTMYDSIVGGDFFYAELDWSKYSEDAHDFVFSLLKVDPEDRPSTKQLLQHPWFC